jgi:adenylate cyclase
MTRRLAAILAADVVGYSRLMAVDEAGTHARLKALRQDFIEPKIAEHHGRVAKLMGDGALVEFASVVDAVECAAAIQSGVAERQAELPEDRRIAFRIGINIGDVIIEGEDIYGDGVNVAARLEALAEPGEICVSRTVYNHAKGKVAFAFEPMGEHRVKNIPEPVTAYRVITEPGPAREGARAEARRHTATAPCDAYRGCGRRASGRRERLRSVAVDTRARAERCRRRRPGPAQRPVDRGAPVREPLRRSGAGTFR